MNEPKHILVDREELEALRLKAKMCDFLEKQNEQLIDALRERVVIERSSTGLDFWQYPITSGGTPV